MILTISAGILTAPTTRRQLRSPLQNISQKMMATRTRIARDVVLGAEVVVVDAAETTETQLARTRTETILSRIGLILARLPMNSTVSRTPAQPAEGEENKIRIDRILAGNGNA